MARGRFISKSIVDDMEFAKLPTKTALFFLLTVPHLDAEGRILGHPRQLKRMVCGLRKDITEGVIESALYILQQGKFVVRYKIEGKEYLYFPAFEEHQIGLRKDREAPSKIPPPPE